MTEVDTRTEQEKVVDYRQEELERAGYPRWIAHELAESEIDLHRAIELVQQGCKPGLAARILL